MKKLLAILLAALLLLSAVACSNSGEAEETTAETEATAADTTASETEAAAAETEAETAAPKKRDQYNSIAINDGGDHSPISLANGTDSAAVRFVVTEGYIEYANASCPSWSDDIGNLTFKLFKWDTDYATTVAGTPVAEQTFENYSDNATLEITFNDDGYGIEAGEYLLWLGDGVDESGSGVGFWAGACNTNEEAIVEYYYNGAVTTGNYAFEGEISIIIPAE